MSASKSRLYHRLQLAAHRLQKSADRAVLAAAEITTAQAAVLMLVAGGANSQREVATQLGLNESAVTAMHLHFIEPVFQRIGDPHCGVRQLALLADRHETGGDLVRHRAAEDEAACLDAGDLVDLRAGP